MIAGPILSFACSCCPHEDSGFKEETFQTREAPCCEGANRPSETCLAKNAAREKSFISPLVSFTKGLPFGNLTDRVLMPDFPEAVSAPQFQVSASKTPLYLANKILRL